jgi:cysteine desulfurase
MRPIYLDYNASTPLAPEVAQVMRRVMDEGFGNPSSAHWAGTSAKTIIDQGRRQVAALLGCQSAEIVFTSGGSEANNLALKGVFHANAERTPHIITTQIEHPAILSPCAFLERLGATITRLPVDGTGLIDPDELRRAIRPATVLITIMHANNEVGTIEPIEECARIAREHDVLFHSDAAQSVGKVSTRVDELGVDLMSLAGHKFHAPKGVGALYVRDGVELEPLIHGAGHESGRRAGTESALLIAALGEASVLASNLTAVPTIRNLRDRLWQRLNDMFGKDIVLNGHPEKRLPNTLNVSFVGRIGADVLGTLADVAASTGSACHAGRVELSPVLEAMGVQANVGMGAVRFSLGRNTTEKEIDAVCQGLSSLS